MKYQLFLILICCISSYISQAQCPPNTCTPLAYDGFEYEDQTPLDALAGGSGWGNVWEVQSDNIDVPGFHISSNNGLSYADLQAFGGGMAGGNSYLSAGRLLDLSENGLFQNYLENGFITAEGTSLFFTAMIRKDMDNDDPIFINLHEGNIPWYDTYSNPQLVGAGYYGTDSNDAGTDYWTLRIFDDYYLSSTPVIIGESVLLVIRIDFGINDNNTYNLWINPSTIGADMPSPNIVENISGEMRIRSLKAYHGSGLHFGIIDEIRFADSYQCVVPDETTLLNRTPVAAVATNTITGTAPLTINFDATASYDPDDTGSIVSYGWDFGDGNNDNGAIVSNTYNYPGEMIATLTITDNCGSTFDKTIVITVLNENGDFPCLSTVRLNQMASHNTANGELEAIGGNNYTLTLPDNSTINQENGTFGGLAAGNYQLDITGNNGCTETFDLTIPTDSTTIEGWTPHICNFGIGMNIDGIPYWNQIRAFKDFALQAGDFFTGPAAGGTWDSGYMDEVAVDQQGYPLEMPYFAVDGSEQLVRSVISADGHMLLGDYVMLYDGEGEVDIFGNAEESSHTAGRLEFSVTGLGNIWYHISESTSGNHIRNIRIVRMEDEANFEEHPFYQPFLDKLNHFEAIRFMDWGHTNGSEQVSWADRKTKDYHTQGHGHAGVAYEWMIDLSNLLQKDIWVCIPHQADEDYIQQMATLFRDNLHSNSTIYLEYSNEVWNWQFSQAHWVNNLKPANWSQQRYYAERSKTVFEIWHEIFGADNERVKRVIATQTVNPWLGEQAMAHLHGEFDYLSPTWYFGYNSDLCQPELEALGENATAQDVLDCSRENFLTQASALRQHHMNAKLFGKEVIEYEGGQHMTSNPVTVSFQQAVYDAQIHPGIYDLYTEVMDSLRIWDSKLAMAFTLASVRESIYGSWGALEYIEQEPLFEYIPKWDALVDNILCYTPPVDFTTSVEAIEAVNHNILLYPNPNSGKIHIDLMDGNHEELNIELFNVLGQQVFSKKIRHPENIVTIDLGNQIGNGTYFISIKNKNALITTKKIVLMRE